MYFFIIIDVIRKIGVNKNYPNSLNVMVDYNFYDEKG